MIERIRTSALIALIAPMAARSFAAAPDGPTPPAPPASAPSGGAATPTPGAAQVMPGPRGAMLRADGRSLAGSMIRIDERGATLLGADGREQRGEWSESLGLVASAGGDGVTDRGGVLVLSDGQRLPGGPEAGASGWRWVQPLLGSFEPPSGSVRSISFDGSTPPPPSPDADVIILRTGDRLEGFVTRLADPLPIEPRTPGAVSMVSMESIASISFVSQEIAATPSTRRIWLRDGTVLDAAIVRFLGGDAVTIEGLSIPGAATATVPIGDIRAIAGDRGAPALAGRPLTTHESAQGAALRYSVTPPERLEWPDRRPRRTGAAGSNPPDRGAWPLGAAAIAFDGPAIMRVAIDEPATLVARARLPRDRRPLGRFQLVVRSGASTIGPFEIDERRREQEIRIEAVPPAIEFEIIDTGGGPVQDGVVIEQGLLIPPQAPGPSPPR